MRQKAIVFDLFGVIFLLKIKTLLTHIGIGNLIWYTLRNRKTPFTSFFMLLDKMRKEIPNEFQDQVTYQGYYLPKSFCDWQKGIITSHTLSERLTTYINQLDSNYFTTKKEKETLIKSALIGLTPKTILLACTLNSSIASLIRKLHHEHYELYILSNIDHELFYQLNKKYSDLFNLFTGIVTSFQTHLIKPDPEIYHYLINHYELNPPSCCFVDDQKENIKAAESVGMNAILYRTGEDLTHLLTNQHFLEKHR